MVKCPFCHAKHVANTIFCDECGQFLIEGKATSTEKFASLEADPNPTKWRDPFDTARVTVAVSEEIALKHGEAGTNPIICLRIGPKKREFCFQLDRPIHLGRLDPSKDIFPDIDLSKDNRKTKVVSRRHARLFVQDNSVMIEDLDSLNGTYLNGERLPPFLSVTLNDGDCLKLGGLRVEVISLKIE